MHLIERVARAYGFPLLDDEGRNHHSGHSLRVSGEQHLAAGGPLLLSLLVARGSGTGARPTVRAGGPVTTQVAAARGPGPGAPAPVLRLGAGRNRPGSGAGRARAGAPGIRPGSPHTRRGVLARGGAASPSQTVRESKHPESSRARQPEAGPPLRAARLEPTILAPTLQGAPRLAPITPQSLMGPTVSAAPLWSSGYERARAR